MIVLKGIVERAGGMDFFRKVAFVRLRRGEMNLVLEYCGRARMPEYGVRVWKSNQFARTEAEMCFEIRNDIWLPTYFRQVDGLEISLWSRNGGSTCIDLAAGIHLIHLAWLLDVQLWASGFMEAAEESLYHPLFPKAAGGAA